MDLHSISLSSKQRASVISKFSSNGSINYKEALAEVTINMGSATLGDVDWTLGKQEEANSDTASQRIGLSKNAVSRFSRTNPAVKTKDGIAISQTATSVITPLSVVSPTASSVSSVKQFPFANNPNFPMKNQLDYPHYKTGEITKFVEEN
jgi:hypothetical protein